MKKCPLCKGKGKIKVDDYSRLWTRVDSCPVCVSIRESWAANRIYSTGRSILLDLLRLQGILQKEA